MTMKKVRIADLKARLSAHLRAVRRGETIAVLDRDTPIARIVPFDDAPRLRMRGPAPGAPAPGRVPRPEPLDLGVDVVELLMEERQSRR
jgi:antitoxin (DNA-binding transcriptional repressor) of toxin-antitoxin stability system